MFKDLKENLTDWYEDVRDDLKLFGFWAGIRHRTRSFFWRNTWWLRQIKHVIEYIPTLWEDRDWDYNYILTLLKYKLQRTRNEIARGCGDDEQWIKPRTAEIDEALRLIDKILENNFVEEEQKAHKEKYGNIKIEFGSRNEKTSTVSSEIYYEKYRENEQLQKEASSENMKIYQLEEERIEKAYDDLFNYLSKNMRKWWD